MFTFLLFCHYDVAKSLPIGLQEQLSSILDKGILTTSLIHRAKRHGMVGSDAKLGTIALGVKHGAGREADAPARRQLAIERHASATARGIAHNLYVVEAVHILNKLVGSAIHRAVGEHHHLFLPAQSGRGRDIVPGATRSRYALFPSCAAYIPQGSCG